MKKLLFAVIFAVASAIGFYINFAVIKNNLYILISSIVAAVACGVFTVLYIYRNEKSKIRDLEERIEVWNQLSYHVSQAGDEATNNLPVGILVYGEDDKIKWANDYLKQNFKSRLIELSIAEVIPQVIDYLGSKTRSFVIEVEGEFYDVLNYRDQKVLYFFNVTEREKIQTKYNNRIPAFGIIRLDNLEESLKDYDMQEKSTIRGQFLGEISDYVSEYGAYLQSYDDMLVMVLDKESLYQMIDNKFDILNKTREIASKNHVRVSVSIGVACYDVEAAELGQLAQSAVELAEKRGGDQVVVNIQNQKMQYFGGKSNALEKNSLVTARIQATALREAIEASTNVYICGHIGADADCLGAMIGTLRMALSSEKDAYIVYDHSKADSSLENVYKALEEESPEIFERIIPLEDVDIKTNSLLIICDTQSPNILMFKELFGNIKRVAVIDHHRRGEIGFDNAIVSYIEPSASSTVELVTEMFAFYNKSIKFEPIDVCAMLSGIVIDTNNFTFRTSARTFEAASILRQLGADMIRVRTLIRSNLEIEQEVATLVTSAEIYRNKFALAIMPKDKTAPARSFLAMVSDKLMHIDGVDAAFTIGYLDEKTIGISARSFEKFNVQVVMEELGGGGHLSNAATQIQNTTIEEAVDKLCEILKANDEFEGEERMKVILLQDVKGRGVKDQIIDVANGYGNYLLTNKLAVLATEENITKVEQAKAQALIDEENHLQVMLKLKNEIEAKKINLYIRVGADGRSFGHITTKQICEEYEAQTGIRLDKRKINLPSDINSVGIYTATVDLHKKVQANIEINVLEK